MTPAAAANRQVESTWEEFMPVLHDDIAILPTARHPADLFDTHPRRHDA